MGKKSLLGQCLDSSKGIRENTSEQIFEFYVAGYTKTCKGVAVQPYHALIHADAARIKQTDPSNIIYPFEDVGLPPLIKLEYDPDNPYDPHAVMVLATGYPDNILGYIDGTDLRTSTLVLGYVPKAISRIVNHNLDILRLGWIKRTRSIHNGKHCSTKVAIPWIYNLPERDWRSRQRLLHIIEEDEEG